MSEQQETSAQQLSFWDKLPIKPGEWTRFLLTASMMALVVFVYSILRGAKDVLIISAIGAEMLSTIKLWGVLPSAIVFMLVYTKMSNAFTRTKIFHILNWFFVGFFAVFAWVLYPNSEAIHFNVDHLIAAMPWARYILQMASRWAYALFYILSEIYGSAILSLCFWQLANQITSINEAKRFYPLFGLIGQIGLGAAGMLGKIFSSISSDWTGTLSLITISILIAGGLLSLCLMRLHNLVGDEKINGTQQGKSGKKKMKLGFVESLKYIMSSPYIGLITLLILCYGVSINLVEGVWKKSMQLQFPDPNDYASYMGDVQIWTAILTGLAMISGSYLLRVLNWRSAAILTPVIILLTGLPFFAFMLFKDSMSGFVAEVGVTSILLAVQFGAAQNVLSKATKYAFFDPTKEMSYIPLDDELKAKGKAAADVIGGRLGKSGGAVIQWFLLSMIPGSTLLSISQYLFAIFCIVMVVWFFAVVALSKQFAIKSAESEAEAAAAASSGEK